jgi:putative tricarboxylic transport membrane protein
MDWLIVGFEQVLQPINLLYCFGGVLLGTLIGVLPGLGPVATISMLLPITLRSSPLESIIILSGVYYGAMYGGSTTSILVNIPGEAASVVTCLDGYQMARKGRAGPALGISALGSFIGGTFSILALSVLALPLSRFAIRFGPPEYFSIIFMGMTLVIYLSSRSVLKASIMAVLGLILSTVGTDIISGRIRLTFGISFLYDGIEIAPMVMGLFGISEVLINMERSIKRILLEERVKNLLPNLKDWKMSIFPITRGSLLGFFLGLIPGGGTILASFASYSVEKRISKHPGRFGLGAIEGVAAPETANNSAVGGAFIPLFALGIPSNVVIALLLASLMLHGVAPGPNFIDQNPELFFAIIASMYIGNIMLLILNLPLIAIWVKLLEVPYKILSPLIMLICVIGAYSINGRTFDIILMLAFGLIGYAMKKLDYEPAPLVFAFVLGGMFEFTFRQSMAIANNNLITFFTKPIVMISISISLFFLVSSFFGGLWKLRKKVIESRTNDD